MSEKPVRPVDLFLHSLIIAFAVLALLATGYGIGKLADLVFRPAEDSPAIVTWGSG